jgi:hypothetical protein
MSDNDIRSDPIFFIHTWAVPDDWEAEVAIILKSVRIRTSDSWVEDENVPVIV